MLRERGSSSRMERERGFAARVLGARVWLYAVILLAIVLFRFVPGLRSHLASPGEPIQPANETVAISGLDLAPVLILRLADDYRREYSSVELRITGGGSRQALEDLINQRTGLAFLNRLPTPEEKEIIASAVGSVETYAVALGGIAALSAKDGSIDSVTTFELQTWLKGGTIPDREGPERFYVPDPNLGLWTALAGQLGVGEDQCSGVVWLADETTVARAVAADPAALGFSSTMALPSGLDKLGVRLVRVRGASGGEAALPGPGEIASGDYPLYHYLYLACLPGVSPAASGFLTFLYDPLGQRLVERAGFIPARQAARIVKLGERPIGES